MRIAGLVAAGGATLLLASACITVTLAPGADKVRVTTIPSAVSSCAAVGNLKASRGADGNIDIVNAGAEFRNQTVGFGGNTALVTAGPPGTPPEGIAYRCP